MVEVMKKMATFFKRSCACTVTLRAPDPAARQLASSNPRLHWRLLDTQRQVWVSLLWGPCSFLLGPGAQGSVCALQESVCPVLCKFCNQIPLPLKSNSLGFSVPLPDPQVGKSVLWSRPSARKRKAKRSFEGAEKRRDTKGKGEKERYGYLNAEFQRIARRDKKAFLSDQCKEIEENKRIWKTRDLFKKIGHQGNTSWKDEHNKGQKWYGPNRSRRY